MNTAINFAKIRPSAIIPSKREEDAGYDIYANFEEKEFVISPFSTRLVPTGIASALEPNFYLQIEERGSTGARGIKKSAGVVDSGFRNEIKVVITNVNDKPLVISKLSEDNYNSEDCVYYPYSKAIAQMILHEVHHAEINEITYDELKSIPSERGVGMLGSSNK